VAEHAPDVDAGQLKAFFDLIQQWRKDDLILAYHDRADGGLFATLCEMAFASKCGLSVMLDTVAYDQYMNDVDGLDKRPDSLKGRFNDMLFKALFAEELGAVIQIRRDDRSRFTEALRRAASAITSWASPTTGTSCASGATPSWFSAPPVPSCCRPGPRPATRSPACATTPSAPRKNSKPWPTTPTPACR
jgi:phosphoribosylformylglycinamidine (FGAM) synthase-like enzyme